MNDKEAQAIELLRHKQWVLAARLYDELLCNAVSNKGTPKEKIVGYLLGRSECNLELREHETVVADCRRIIKLLADAGGGNNGTRAHRRLCHALVSLHRFTEAEVALHEWVKSCVGGPGRREALKMLERLQIALQVTDGSKGTVRPLGVMNNQVEGPLPAQMRQDGTGGGPGMSDRQRRLRKHPVELVNEPLSEHINIMKESPGPLNLIQHNQFVETSEGGVLSDILHREGDVGQQEQTVRAACSYCSMTFSGIAELRAHCQSETHQTVIMSDEGRDWKWRPPPRHTGNAYSLCESYLDGEGVCRYGAQCVDAHGQEELAEWRERFEYRRMKLQRAYDKELFGKSYTEQLLERWIQAPTPEKVMRERLPDVQESCDTDLVTTVSSKVSSREWVFVLRSNRPLRAVALLQDAHRNHFFITHMTVVNFLRNCASEWQPSNQQEWCVPSTPVLADLDVNVDSSSFVLEHRIRVYFTTDIYGTFRQSVVFDFGREPVLVRHLCVDVVPVTDVDRMKEIQKELVLSTVERWDPTNTNIVAFSSPLVPISTPAGCVIDNERDADLIRAYPTPCAETFSLTQSTVTEKKLTRNNYRARMHELLYVEEMARYEQVARYNVTTNLRLADCYLLAPSGTATSTAKYAQSGELFALMDLAKDVSEDTSAGRLILSNCTTVLLAPALNKMDSAKPPPPPSHEPAKKTSVGTAHSMEDSGEKRVVYEALIEDKGKNMIYLRLSASTVQGLHMKPDTDYGAEIQFQLNRIPYCEWHYAIDKIANFRVIFPDTYLEPSIPWTPQRQWSDIQDSRLNLKQKEAVVAITTPINFPLPPILIIGPFGTGKTYTLAQAIKQILMQPDTRVLVCTHSNSAADLYIKDYLHPYVEEGREEARPLRIYYHKRWVATVNPVVQKYCLIETKGGARTFRVPKLEDVQKHRIVVGTLSISAILATLGLEKGYFTHILLDEAAQAMECEAIMPLALASDSTRIVLAGDHMQLSPELFSQFAKERNLHVSLLERLYDHYPGTFPCKILLCENYRAHEAIIQFTSELFYDQKLISSGKQPRHDLYFPLTFFTTRGEDVQDVNSTAFYNNAEVYEVVERVCELRKKWPAAWGKLDDQSIGIMTPYADQVFRIRSELRKRRMGGISVERVLNVQGKQFRAIFLSTVRTRRTCQAGTKSTTSGDEMDYGFLSNSKLLNTAITRAQSLVAVVGDPVALCSIGRCRKVWERFIEICNTNKSLFGITWSYLRSQLDGVELKKTYVLNPLAPEFVPRQLQGESYIRLQSSILGQYNTTGCNMIPAVRFPPAPVSQYATPSVYPMYYLAQPPAPPVQQAPPIQLMHSIHPPLPSVHLPQHLPVMFPPQPPPSNQGPSPAPWGLNYPLVSPSGTTLFPTNPQGGTPAAPWPHGAMPKRVRGIAEGRVEEVRLPPGLSYSEGPQQSKTPRPKAHVSPTGLSGNLCDSYIPGDAFSPGPLLQNSIENPFYHLSSPAGHPPNEHMLPKKHPGAADKLEGIQFLQNVHFPESRPEGISCITPEQVNMLRSYIPMNIDFGEFLRSRGKQLEVYVHLMNSGKTDDAAVYLELLSRLDTSRLLPFHTPRQDRDEFFLPAPEVVRGIENLFIDNPVPLQGGHLRPRIDCGDSPHGHASLGQNPHGQGLHVQGPHGQGLPGQGPHRQGPLPGACPPALHNGHLQPQVTHPNHAGRAGPIHGSRSSWHDAELLDLRRHVVLGEGDPCINGRMLPPQQHITMQQHIDEGGFPFEQSGFGEVDENNAWQCSQPSVPLYRRQAPQHQALHLQDGLPLKPVHSLVGGVVDNSASGNSGAFAGYAKAAISSGLQQCDIPSQASLVHSYNPQQPIDQSTNSNESCAVNGALPSRSMGNTTYASVVRAQPAKVSSSTVCTEEQSEKKSGDDLSVLHPWNSSAPQGSTGLYHYFS